MSITKAELAKRAAEKLRIYASNEELTAADQAIIEHEIDAVKAELEAAIFRGDQVLWEGNTLDECVANPFLLCLLPEVAPYFNANLNTAGMYDMGKIKLCRILATGYNPELNQ